jgi:hypothetical protein
MLVGFEVLFVNAVSIEANDAQSVVKLTALVPIVDRAKCKSSAVIVGKRNSGDNQRVLSGSARRLRRASIPARLKRGRLTIRLIQSPTGNLFAAVPELTTGADIQLNARTSLQGHTKAIA